MKNNIVLMYSTLLFVFVFMTSCGYANVLYVNQCPGDICQGLVAYYPFSGNANDHSEWTANTDDLTDASDCVTADFYDTPTVADDTVLSSAATLTATIPSEIITDGT